MKKVLRVLLVILGALLLTLGWLFWQIVQSGWMDEQSTSDAIAVLGAAEYAGKPSPVFQARLDHAYELFQRGIAPTIITTGGTHPGEAYSEGLVGKIYLAGKGVPPEHIIAEEHSLTTKQNIMRIADIAKQKGFSKITLVSDPFHMYRASLIARDLHLQTFSSPTRTSPIEKNFWLELWYLFRELLLSLLHILFDV